MRRHIDVTLDSIRDVRIYQSKSGYRFSVDALLLYEFVNLKKVGLIADLGAGTGIIGILLAKKYPVAQVTLIEFQKGLAKLAEENIAVNRLESRMHIVNGDIRELAGQGFFPCGFDLVVSNPPFRRYNSGRINAEEEKAIARHEIKLSLHELVEAASSLLRTRGRLCIIYHPNRLSELTDTLREKNIEPKRLRFVHSHISSEAKMVLLEAVKGGRTGLKVERPLYIYRENGGYTEEMERLYGNN
jgi:tRNA1Val (adenine37-N6)-methyltransferase